MSGKGSNRGSRNGVNGRPPIEWTDKDRETVRALRAYGISIAEIAVVLSAGRPGGKVYDRDTISKAFKTELATAGIQANAEVAAALYKNCTKNMNVNAQKFWLQCRGNGEWIPAEERKLSSDMPVKFTVNMGGPVKKKKDESPAE